MTPLLVGLDVGTTNVKALVYEPDGRAVARASVPTPTHHPRPGWAFYRAEELWEQSAAALRRALAQVDDPRRVAAVAVASMGEAGVTLDATGLPTGDVIAWFDTRSQPQADRLATLVGADELFARTGLSVQPIWSLCKMLWLREHEPDAWGRAVRWLNVADYVAHRLGGEPATGHSLASRTLALDVHRRRWDEELIRAAELDPALLPPLLAEGTAVGGVSPDVARLTGLPAGATIGVGGHDHLCGALAAGVTEPGGMLESLGTTDTMLLATDRPLTDPLLGRQGYSQGAHVVPDRWYVYGGQYTFGASIEWFLATFGGDGIDALIAEASSVPAGSHGVAFLPHLRLANPPHVDPASRGAFVGLSTFAGRPVLFRALLEGLGFEARNALDPLLALAGIDAPTDGRAIGGVTRNRLLMEIRASTRGAPIDVLDLDEATALGAAVLGGLAAGVYRDVPDALGTLRYARTRVEPVAEDVPRYDRLFRTVHRRLYPALAPLSHALAAEDNDR